MAAEGLLQLEQTSLEPVEHLGASPQKGTQLFDANTLQSSDLLQEQHTLPTDGPPPAAIALMRSIQGAVGGLPRRGGNTPLRGATAMRALRPASGGIAALASLAHGGKQSAEQPHRAAEQQKGQAAQQRAWQRHCEPGPRRGVA